jgi:hypothetical protein
MTAREEVTTLTAESGWGVTWNTEVRTIFLSPAGSLYLTVYWRRDGAIEGAYLAEADDNGYQSADGLGKRTIVLGWIQQHGTR